MGIDSLLDEIKSKNEMNDSWLCKIYHCNSFTVESCYNFLIDLFMSYVNDEVVNALKTLWKCDALSKVLTHAWNLLQNMLLTRVDLLSQSIVAFPHETSCNCWFNHKEYSNHPFFACSFSY